MELVGKCLCMLLCTTENLYYFFSRCLECEGEMCGKVARAEEDYFHKKEAPQPPKGECFYTFNRCGYIG